jgi:hypothetical protein
MHAIKQCELCFTCKATPKMITLHAKNICNNVVYQINNRGGGGHGFIEPSFCFLIGKQIYIYINNYS